MSTIRVSKTRDYSVVSNHAANDKELSWKAKGILYYLLTKPDSWTVNRDNLVHMSTDGETSVRSALCELESLGYLRRNKKRMHDGTFTWESVIYEVPTCQVPVDDYPSGGFPPLDKTPLVSTDAVKTELVITPLPPKGELLTEEQKAEDYLITNPRSKANGVTNAAIVAPLESLVPLYAGYRHGLNGTPIETKVPLAQVKRCAKALNEMLDAGYTPEQISQTTAKMKASWDDNSQGVEYKVSPTSVLEHWDKYVAHKDPPLSGATPPATVVPVPTYKPATLARIGTDSQHIAHNVILHTLSGMGLTMREVTPEKTEEFWARAKEVKERMYP
jgi:hypothetical protein